jgi:hypothetical protein
MFAQTSMENNVIAESVCTITAKHPASVILPNEAFTAIKEQVLTNETSKPS